MEVMKLLEDYSMTTKMTYDMPLVELWEQAVRHITTGEHG
jgi:hypothetical protein